MMTGYYTGYWWMMGLPMVIGWIIILIFLWNMVKAQEKIAQAIEKLALEKKQDT